MVNVIRLLLLLLLVFVDDARWLLKRALRTQPFYAAPVAAVDVATAVADTEQPPFWPWHALLWTPFYFSHLDSDWRFRVCFHVRTPAKIAA